MSTMKGVLAGTLIAAGMAVGVRLAGPASATMSTIGDPDDYSGYNYAAELHFVGIPASAAQARSFALTICQKRAEGYSEDQLLDALESPPGPTATSEQAVEMVLGGEYHSCHAYEHDGSIGRGSGPSSPSQTV